MYTKNGRPLQVHGNCVFSRSGKPVGQIRGNKVFGPDGRYVGSIDGGRLVYRSTEDTEISSSFSTASIAGSASANVAGLAIWGDEPNIPD